MKISWFYLFVRCANSWLNLFAKSNVRRPKFMNVGRHAEYYHSTTPLTANCQKGSGRQREGGHAVRTPWWGPLSPPPHNRTGIGSRYLPMPSSVAANIVIVNEYFIATTGVLTPRAAVSYAVILRHGTVQLNLVAHKDMPCRLGQGRQAVSFTLIN